MAQRVSISRACVRIAWLGLGVFLGLPSAADARVTRINITTVESPTFDGASFGAVGQYERIEGTITGEVDPNDPLNSVIVDIGLARPRNANGTLGYSADFQIVRPIDWSKGNHRVVFDLPNRGRLTAVKLTSGPFGGPGSFGPTALYEFTYVARDPIVAGLGFAALRDLAALLRSAKTDDNGVANPLAGNVQRIYTTCVSQPCRTTRDFMLYGFNEAEQTHDKVFDGMLNWIGGGDGIFMNYRFAQPTRTHRQHIARWTPEFQFPFADVPFFDRVTGQFGSRLDRCLKSFTCPKIFEVNSENEYWAKGGSMLTTDGQGHDLDLDAVGDVRYYQLASLPHGAGTAPGICQQPQNPLVANQVLRALLLDLDAWVSSGQKPPHNRVPRLADHTLVPALPQSGVGFPNIPGVNYNGIHHTGDLWDFGPQFNDGILTILPPKLIGTPYEIFVPKTDADGNDIAGIPHPRRCGSGRDLYRMGAAGGCSGRPGSDRGWLRRFRAAHSVCRDAGGATGGR
jgi:hypothetical protein